MTLGDRLSTRDNALNFVRLVLAAAVIWSHTPPIAYGQGAPLWGERSIGEWAVGGFFAISGYLIANSRSRLDLLNFLWRRGVRIFPGFWVALIAVAFVFAPVSTLVTSNPYSLRDGLRYVTSNLALDMRTYTVGSTLAGVPYPAAWNGSCWTLVYEFGAYLVAGLLFTVKPLRTPVFLAAATGFLVIGRPLLLAGVSARTADALWLGSFFAAGMLAWSLRARLKPSWTGIAICIVVLVVAALTSTFLLIGQLPLCYLVLCLGALLPVRLGSTNDISYGVYVYAFPIQQLLAIVGAGALGYWAFCLLALLLTVPFAALSWYAVEKPALRLNSVAKRLTGTLATHWSRLVGVSVATTDHEVGRPSATPADAPQACAIVPTEEGDAVGATPSVQRQRITDATLIMTVFNEGDGIRSFLDTLSDQTVLPREIVIVDGGSPDGTVDAIKQWTPPAGVDLILDVCPGANISAGRNRAIRAASSDLILVTDAGTTLSPRWVESISAPFAASSAPDVVSGFFTPRGESFLQRVIAFTITPLLDEIDPASFLPSSRSVAFRKSAWASAGGYPEWLDYCEDLIFDLAMKADGVRFEFAPDANVTWSARPNLRAFMVQYYRYARGDGKADLWLKRHLARYGAYALGAGLLAASRRRPWLLVPLAGGLFGYLGKFGRRVARRRGDLGGSLPVALALVPCIVVAGDIAKMVGYPVGTMWRLRGRRDG